MGNGSIAIVQLGKPRLDKVSELPKSPRAHMLPGLPLILQIFHFVIVDIFKHAQNLRD